MTLAAIALAVSTLLGGIGQPVEALNGRATCIYEPWSGRDGKARTYCGRNRPANDVEPRRFSTVHSWCLVCYHARRKAIAREFATRPGDRSAVLSVITQGEGE